ncbi:MAG: aldo/keto reductase [candidate division KSB1 bacterium]|nr:aldo/keto reductase [candidate division KSB1 bacterium]MDZ7301824.1 aldo/keto reductase [candidate division KSB1 bacterium]MDZ7314150.1 aldo/keto reductase [candidate division KSB1 bacterium]
MEQFKELNRRDFVRTIFMGSVASLVPWRFAGQSKKDNARKDEVNVQYRTLGRTGLKVSVVGFGAMRTSDPNVIHHALNKGVNYIDTARSYMDGNNEIIVGNVLKTRRKETYIATKLRPSSEDEMMTSVATSLKCLQTDVIDVILLHSLVSRAGVFNEEAMNALDKMRKKGMVRFVGFSTHKNQVECLEASIEAKFYDVILVSYNFKSDPAIGEAITKVAQAGIGVVGMKTQAGGYTDPGLEGWSPHQAALRWVLQNPGMATTIPSMVTIAQVDENVKVMGKRFGAHDQEILERYGELYDRVLCRTCGTCEKQCQFGVPIQDINRSLMYAEGYRDYDLALRTYRELFTEAPLQACLQCENCTVTCKYGLDIPARLARAREIFGTVMA